MRKILILAAIMLLTLNLFAENPRDEAVQSLDNAKQLLQKDQYVQAQDEINFALSKISEILAEQLLKFIPEAPAGFKLEDKDSQALGQAGAIIGGANTITATATYTKDDAELKLQIMIGGSLGGSSGLMGLATMFGGMGNAGKTVRVKGYNGNQQFDKDESSGTLTVNVGSKITVMVTGEDIDNPALMTAIAEAVDMATLEKSF
ncbi:MAG TPA: hypothetical protein PLG20_00405 [Candidatus Syntrophosphaera sp.]|jgi:hypothetical protein|nr:hypothetical protein [Candidatus Cloacimonadota bacterium]HOZ00244.1 hypothetical protein [Candidatus Syntrophosphaera sp.]